MESSVDQAIVWLDGWNSDMVLLVCNITAAVYDPQKAAKELKESKDRELKKIESARKRSNGEQ